MHRTNRTLRAAVCCPLSGIPTLRAPRAGWRRDDPGDTGDTTAHNNGGGSGSDDDAGKAGNDDGPKIDGDFDPERARKAIAAAREAEKKAKGDAKAAKDQVAAILKAAGLAPDGSKDPAEQLKAATEAAEKATQAARQTAVELAVYKVAGKAGADPDALLDSRGFATSVADLDPEDRDFTDKVRDAVKAAVKANPKLAAGTTGQGSGTGRQGADHTGGNNQPRRAGGLDAAVRKAFGG
ncbi:hypothetical protein EDC02_5933 [Micromonospora sp. Llam0]|uniref:hypothetical protein n=1 Tax=Micromonospora sp. Llam0 TaxID=2485143 RepID=UPI000F497312|nr:hypothetical protein [Micromonospora sp. Llam0]ROO51069.1 hypothetical protein EDC02_5933 [Micromonospora sp. Llam0]